MQQNPTITEVIMEYLVKVSKRRAFWSLNEDILKITILKTNTPYPSRKIRRICACTHQRPRGIKLNTPYPEDQYAVLELWNQYNILEDIKRGPYSKKSPIRRLLEGKQKSNGGIFDNIKYLILFSKIHLRHNILDACKMESARQQFMALTSKRLWFHWKSFDYRVTLDFGSIAGGLDHVNPVIRLPLEHGIIRVLGKVDHPNLIVGTNQVIRLVLGIVGINHYDLVAIPA
ncbi:hypothetical protein Tco_0641602 [Tanacetum coccineum]